MEYMDWHKIEFPEDADRLAEKEPVPRKEYDAKVEELESKLWDLRYDYDRLLNRVESMADEVHHFLGG